MLVWKKKFLLAAAILLIALLARNLYVTRSTSSGADLSQAVDRYVKAVYARDFNAAYLWLAATDRQKKDRETYAREQGAFAGFTLKLATRLASLIETQPAQPPVAGEIN